MALRLYGEIRRVPNGRSAPHPRMMRLFFSPPANCESSKSKGDEDPAPVGSGVHITDEGAGSACSGWWSTGRRSGSALGDLRNGGAAAARSGLYGATPCNYAICCSLARDTAPWFSAHL